MKQKTVRVIALIIVLAMVITSVAFVFFSTGAYAAEAPQPSTVSDEELQELEQRLDSLEEYMLFIKKFFKDDVSLDKLINGAFDGTTDILGDPYSIYYEDAQTASNYQQDVSGNYEGVGVTIQRSGGQCVITDLAFGGPAAGAGIQTGDVILELDGIDISEKTLAEISSMLRGEAGTKVNIKILRNGAVYEIDVTRALIAATSVKYELLENDIGYIKISSFDNDSDFELKKARIALIDSGAKSLILDIRDNGGGLINVAVRIADQFIEEGPITHLYRQGELVNTIEATRTNENSIPMTVLVNSKSASASELLAGALQDSEKATIVGTKTYGKGIAQALGTLEDQGGYKLSICYFLTPDQRDIDGVGITPDVEVQNHVAEDMMAAQSFYAGFAPMNEKVKASQGMTGLNVYGAQQRLQLMGYNVKITGVMDAGTVAAVRSFQSVAGLWAYGVLDYTTMKSLDTAAYNYAYGIAADDAQLKEAIRILKQL